MSNFSGFRYCGYVDLFKVVCLLIFEVLRRVKLGKHFARVVVEELLRWTKLASDGLDDLLSNVASIEGRKWVEYSLRLEGEEH